jgi:hypothetical protein
MSQNEIRLEPPISSENYLKNIFNPYKSNLNPINDQPEMNFIYTQPLPSYNNIFSRENRNQSLYKSQDDYENNYIKERYNKIKEENANLKLKLFELEKEYKIKKGEMDEQVLILRDENSNLQLQIQKILEKQKMENSISDNIHNENIALINNINLLKNDSMFLKDDITRKVADIEEKNKIINDLRNEKTILLNDQKNMKNQIETLNNDKEILLKQIKDLNDTIGEKIAPKLKENENSLTKLQEQVENLRVENEKLKSDNLLLFNENNIQKNLIQILTKQNKKLLGEIKTIYDRDILLMDNMEKIGSNSTNKYKKIFDNNTNEHEILLEEEKNILENSERYVNKNNDIKEYNKNEKSEEICSSSNDNDNEDIKEINNIQNDNNLNKVKHQREINSLINNEIVVKRNKESFENENNKNIKININYENNEIDKKYGLNLNDNDDILKNEQKKFQKINISNPKILKENNSKKNKVKYRNYNFNSQSFTEGNFTQNKFTETDEDLKIGNRTLNRNFKPKNLSNDIVINTDSDKKDELYNTDGIFNMQSKKDEIFMKFENKLNNNENNYEASGLNTNDENKKLNNLNLYNNSDNNVDENNNILFHSQTKSQLSEYVEDLDVIQYK